MNSAAVKTMMMPMTPAANPMPIAAFEERRDGFGEGEEDSCAVGVDSDVYCKEGVGASVPSTCMAVVVIVTVVNSVNTWTTRGTGKEEAFTLRKPYVLLRMVGVLVDCCTYQTVVLLSIALCMMSFRVIAIQSHQWLLRARKGISHTKQGWSNVGRMAEILALLDPF
jgi:hypothetical protein